MEHDVVKRDRKDKLIRSVLHRAVKWSREHNPDVNEIFTINVSAHKLNGLNVEERKELLQDLDNAAVEGKTNLRVHSTSAGDTIIHLYVAQRH